MSAKTRRSAGGKKPAHSPCAIVTRFLREMRPARSPQEPHHLWTSASPEAGRTCSCAWTSRSISQVLIHINHTRDIPVSDQHAHLSIYNKKHNCQANTSLGASTQCILSVLMDQFTEINISLSRVRLEINMTISLAPKWDAH